MQCPNCRFDIADSAVSCQFCQFVFPKSQAQPSQAPEPSPPAELPAAPGNAWPEPPSIPSSEPLPPLESSGAADQGDAPTFEEFGQAPPPSSDPWPELPPAPSPQPWGPSDTPVPAAKLPSGGSSSKLILLGLGAAILAVLLGRLGLFGGHSSAPKAAAPRVPPPAPPAAPAEQPVAAPAPVAAAPVEEPKPEVVWKAEGVVYDMVTLQPVYGADIHFTGEDPDDEHIATTDQKGRYSISLPPIPGGGYRMMVDHADYADGYFDEITPPYKETPLRDRKMLGSVKPKGRPFVGKADRAVRRDLILFPTRMKK